MDGDRSMADHEPLLRGKNRSRIGYLRHSARPVKSRCECLLSELHRRGVGKSAGTVNAFRSA